MGVLPRNFGSPIGHSLSQPLESPATRSTSKSWVEALVEKEHGAIQDLGAVGNVFRR